MPGLTTIVHKKFITTFFAQITVSFVYCLLVPTLPLYFSRRGYSEMEIGVLIGSLGLSSLVLRPFVGRFLQKTSEVRFMMAGTFLFTLTSILLTWEPPLGFLLGVRVFQGVACAFFYTAALKSYLWNAEKTFVLQSLTPYFTNPRKELTRSPVWYFHDLGLCHYMGGFTRLQSVMRIWGPLFQNLVWRLFWEGTRDKPVALHFWRIKDEAEVDFVIETRGVLFPIEVKYRRMQQPHITRALRSFISAYQPSQAWVVNLDLFTQLQINDTQVRILPYYHLMDLGKSGLLN